MNFFKITDLAYNEFKRFLKDKSITSSYIRIYLTGMSCQGPVFNITLDEPKAEDLVQKVEDINFIVDKNLFIKYSGFLLLCGEENGLGTFSLEPIFKPENSSCSGCSGCSDSQGLTYDNID